MRMKQFLCLSTVLFLLAACTGPGADSGFAPGAAIVPDPEPTTSSTNHPKYGEQITTANSWTVAADTTDPVEHKVLPNGWTVEVKYE